MKKKLSTVLLCVLMISGLMGCSGGADRGTQSGTLTENSPKESSTVIEELTAIETTETNTHKGSIIEFSEVFIYADHIYFIDKQDWVLMTNSVGTYWGGDDQIVRCNLDGTDKETIISNQGKINSLAIDNDELYYSLIPYVIRDGIRMYDSSLGSTYVVNLNEQSYTSVFVVDYNGSNTGLSSSRQCIVNSANLVWMSGTRIRVHNINKNESTEFILPTSSWFDYATMSPERFYYYKKDTKAGIYSINSVNFFGADLQLNIESKSGYTIVNMSDMNCSDEGIFIEMSTKEFGSGIYYLEFEKNDITKLTNDNDSIVAVYGNKALLDSGYVISADGKMREKIYDVYSNNIYLAHADSFIDRSYNNNGICFDLGEGTEYLFFDKETFQPITISIERTPRPEE